MKEVVAAATAAIAASAKEMGREGARRESRYGLFVQILAALKLTASVLSYLAYDQYRLGKDTVHIEDAIDLDEFVMLNFMVDHSFPHMQADENGLVFYPGETDQSLHIYVASDKAKKFVSSLLDALRENERHGICFGEFGWNNLLLRLNYTNAHTVIAHLFVNDVSDDIGDLLDLMQYNFAERSLFSIHSSLVSMANHSGLFEEFFDTLFNVVPPAELHDILQRMRAAFPLTLLHWRAWVNSNDLLMETFNFNGGQSYVIPQNAPNQRNLSRDQRIMLGHLRISIVGRQILTVPELELIGPLQLLLFLRNRPAHRMEHYQRFLTAHAD
ncbi:unnamed protein product [Miscanthus lutarioriparius]|uniref:Uncharacterized protein n=1 Tax=Miscanthus lutarioriparius TaxID=422564 RepID=A0A811S1J0_9POAL|nr:unnamed protein product [Miscanthus lutarioriparius]